MKVQQLRKVFNETFKVYFFNFVLTLMVKGWMLVEYRGAHKLLMLFALCYLLVLYCTYTVYCALVLYSTYIAVT